MFLALDLLDILVQGDTAVARRRHNMFLQEELEQVVVDNHGVVAQNSLNMLMEEDFEVSLLVVADFFSDIRLETEDILVESEEVLQSHV